MHDRKLTRANTWDDHDWVVDSRTPFVSKGEHSVTGGVLILLNVSIGLAFLNMPYTFKLTGQMTCLVMLLVGGTATFTAHLVFRAIEMTAALAESQGIGVEQRDWGYLAEIAGGAPGRAAAEFCFRGELVTYSFSFLCALGVHLHLLLPAVSTEQGVIAWTVATFLMSYLPPGMLGKIAFFGHFGYLILAVCLYYSTYTALGQPDAPRLTELARENWGRAGGPDALPNLPTVIETCVYSWAAHSIVPSVAGSMVDPRRVKRVIFITFPLAVGAAMLIGITGYSVLGPSTRQVFTENLGMAYWRGPEGDALEGLSWMRMLATASVAVKLEASLLCFLLPLLASVEAGARGPLARLARRAALLLAMGLAAYTFGDEVVLAVALAGATFGNTLVFILPCMVYYGVKRRLEVVGPAEAALLAAIVLLGGSLTVYGVYDCAAQLVEG